MKIINNIFKFSSQKMVPSKMLSITSQFNQRLMCAKNILFLSMSRNFFEISPFLVGGQKMVPSKMLSITWSRNFFEISPFLEVVQKW